MARASIHIPQRTIFIEPQPSIRPLMSRLQKFTPKDLSTNSLIKAYINDITVGWDIDEVLFTELTTLFQELYHRMEAENILIPNYLWNAWIYVIEMNSSPEKSRIPSLKYIGQKTTPHAEKLNAIDIFLSQVSFIKSIRQIENLFDFLLQFTECTKDVELILRGYLRLNGLRSAIVWEKIIVRFIYYKDTSFGQVMELIQLMLDENINPTKELAPIIKHYVTENRKLINKFGGRFINRMVNDENTLNDFLVIGFLDADQAPYAIQFIHKLLKLQKESETVHSEFKCPTKISPDVLGYTIFRLFQMKKSLAAFTLIRDLTPKKWDIEYPLMIKKRLSSIPRVNLHKISTPDFHDYVVSGLISGGYPTLAQKLFDGNLGFVKTEKLYNLMAQGYLKLSVPSLDQAARIISNLQFHGLKVYRKTYLAFIYTLYTLGKREQLLMMLKEMLKKYGLCLQTYTLILKMNLEVEGIKEPIELLVHMLKNDIQPDILFFITWMQRLIKEKKYQECVDVFKIASDHVELSVSLYSIQINALVKMRDFEKAEELFHKMLNQGPPPNKVTYSTLMSGYIQNGNITKALYFYGFMIGYSFEFDKARFLAEAEKADNVAIWTILDALLKNQKIESFERVFRKTLNSGFKLEEWRTKQVVEVLLNCGYFWPVVMVSSGTDRTLEQAKRYIDLSNLPHEKLLDKFELFLKNLVESTPDVPNIIKYQYALVRILSEKYLLAPFLEQEMEQIIDCTKLMLLIIVHRRLNLKLDFAVPTAMKSFLQKHLNFPKSQKYEIYPSVIQFSRPKFQPKSTEHKSITKNESILKLAYPYIKHEKPPQVVTVSSIATDMFPTLVGCISLYHSLKNPFGIQQNKQPFIIPQPAIKIDDKKTTDLSLVQWNKTAIKLESTSKRQKECMTLMLKILQKKAVNRVNVLEACEMGKVRYPAFAQEFRWLRDLRGVVGLLKRYRDQ